MAICRFVAPLHSNLDPGTFSSCHPLERKRSLLMVVQLLGWILGGRGHILHFGLSPHLGDVGIVKFIRILPMSQCNLDIFEQLYRTLQPR